MTAKPGPPRPKQVWPEGNWRTWLLLGGRGFGKTRPAAEAVIDFAIENPNSRIGIMAATAADVRDTCFEGESGLLACLPNSFRENYNRSLNELWINGSYIKGFSAEEPKRLRGPQHHLCWCDELAAWTKMQEAWDMMLLGLRLGDDPRVIVGTTPRPLPLIRELLKAPTTVVSRGTSYENRDNLAESWFTDIITKYEGTRLGRQELEAEMLEDMPGALWTLVKLDEHRIKLEQKPEMRRITVNIDPSGSGPDSDEQGITATGLGMDGHGYVLADVSSRLQPMDWARRAVNLYYKLDADCIVAEKNYGGDLVKATINTIDKNVRVVVVTASRGKAVRAEPISSLYEQGRAHHVGVFKELEEQMCAFTPTAYGLRGSPDRMDSMVWGFTELFGHDLSLGLTEYMKAEIATARLTPELTRMINKIAGVKDLSKPETDNKTTACESCGGKHFSIIGGGIRRCSNCGTQLEQKNLILSKPQTRGEYLAK